MKRRLPNLVTLLSLLLCVAAVALWVRSQFLSDYVAYDGPVDPGLYARCWISTYTGYVGAAVDRRYTDSPQEREAAAAAVRADNPRTGLAFWRTAARYVVTGPYTAPDWSERYTWNFGLPHLQRYHGADHNLPGGGDITEDRWGVEVPFWFLAVAFALPPLRWELRRRRADRRKRLGLCRRCGYDLKDNQSGVCPECGTPVPTTQTTTHETPAD